MEDTWGLTWSGKWHAIDPRRRTGQDGAGATRCGIYVYTQAQIRADRHPRHLLKILEEDPGSAPTCKRCEKAALAVQGVDVAVGG